MMRLLRSLGLILVACGLFVQSAAYASALPQVPTALEGPCDEMRMEAGPVDASGDQQEPCKDFRLDCLVALGCIAPLAMAAEAPGERAIIAPRASFARFTAFSLAVVGQGPEPPPPQVQLRA
jgi:hypothetical protein